MKKIEKKDIPALLKELSRTYDILAPMKKDQGECMFDTFQEGAFTLDYAKPSLPPKGALFPQIEQIFAIEESEYRQTPHEAKKLLFGIRSCDMAALLQSRSFMSSDFTDIYYEARAKGIVTVVMACPGPQSPTCFCTTTSSGPWSREGYDLQLFDAGDSLLVDIGSPVGESIASSPLFQDADDPGSREAASRFKQDAEEKIPIIPEIREAMDLLARGGDVEEIWERLGKKCITCGGCTFVCPTCTCFNVFDRVTGPGAGERLRTWDACLYAGFTREASGHNPRKSQGQRLKRRHEHKLLFHDDRGKFGCLCTCVGCGRCSDYCPVHIGTIEVAKAAAATRP